MIKSSEFAEFLRAFEKQRGVNVAIEDELDTIDAFVALGTCLYCS